MRSEDLQALLAKSALFETLSAFLSPPGPNRPPVEEVPPRWRSDIRSLALDRPAAEESFGGVFGESGACPAGEVSYRSLVPAGNLLADIAGFYLAFGYPWEGTPDRISTELGFVAFLFAKEANAEWSHDSRHSEVIRRAREDFLADHLGQWAAPFARTIEERVGEGFYARAARAVRRAVEEGSPAGVEASPLARNDEPFACGGCPLPQS